MKPGDLVTPLSGRPFAGSPGRVVQSASPRIAAPETPQKRHFRHALWRFVASVRH